MAKEEDTAEKIKVAARRIFQRKGFAGTKTRDIAEEAGINLALLNYYFRSKKKLFDIIVLETLQNFFQGLVPLLNNEETTIKEKLAQFVDIYIDMLTENPHIATFILTTGRQHPEILLSNVGSVSDIKSSVFMGQFMKGLTDGTLPPINPIHLMLNLIGLVVFPFVAAPILTAVTGVEEEAINEIIQERKKYIPLWIDEMLKVK